jgi:phage nucleotide-binding protein
MPNLEKIGGKPVRSASQVERRFTCLLYGASGVGKTTLAASSSEVSSMSPVLFLDIEDGQEAVKDLYHVDSVRTTNIHELQKIYEELRRGSTGYNTVVVDNVTELQQHGMADIMDETDEWVDPEVPGWPTYQRSTEQMRRFVRGFRDLQMNVIFTAHVTTEENERTKKERYRPYLTKKVSEQIPGFVNQVLYMFVQGKEDRIVQTVTTDSVVAKDRSRKLPETIKSPNMQTVWDYMEDKQHGQG